MLQLQLHSVNKLNRDALQIISDIAQYMQTVDRNPPPKKHIKLDDYVLLLVKIFNCLRQQRIMSPRLHVWAC